MKKISIVIGWIVVLILATPLIISYLANKNIDKKISHLTKEGFTIIPLKKDISYLSTTRVFKVELNDNTKNDTWRVYHEFLDKVDFILKLRFKNLPITKADMDLNLTYPYKLNSHIITKDFRTFHYQIYAPILKNTHGIYHRAKYDTNTLDFDKAVFANTIISAGHIHSIIKSLKLKLFDLNITADHISNALFHASSLNGEISTHLLPNQTFLIDSHLHLNQIAFGNIIIKQASFTLNSTDTTGKFMIDWQKTKSFAINMGSGHVKGEFNVTNPANIYIKMKIDSTLYRGIMEFKDNKWIMHKIN
ncbi:MAG: hypothetical protein GXO40_04430 [Epsilonproteobacteria bacterium]|nr:hypothetical protein [Campylobacterota bacterium]